MRVEIKRKLASWALLSVFVPMMMLAAFHVHQGSGVAESECVECLHHIHHAGHLTTAAANIHNCVLCQFISLPFISATTVSVLLITSLLAVVKFYDKQSLICCTIDSKSTRAPPFKL
jgi:hypothetical protein